MGALITSLTAALLVASPQPIKEAVQDLVDCKNLRHQRCLAAATALKNSGPRALKPVLRAFPKMKPRAGQLLAIGLFSEHKGKRGTMALLWIVKDQRVSAPVRALAIDSLSERVTKRVTRGLLKLAQGRAAMIRAAAIRALGNRLHRHRGRLKKRVVRALLKGTEDKGPTVRLEAVMGLGLAKAVYAAAAIRVRLRDTEIKVRRAAADAFRSIKYASAVKDLITCLNDDDGRLRQLSGQALVFQTGKKQFGERYELWREWYRNR